MHLALFPLDEQTCYLNIASCEYLRHCRHHHRRRHNYYQFSLFACYLNMASCECPRHYRHHHRCRRHNYNQFSLSTFYLNIASCEHPRYLCDQLSHYQCNQFPCCFLCKFFMKQGLRSWAINYPITLVTWFFSHLPLSLHIFSTRI